MTTARDLGLVEGGNFATPLAVGDSIEISGLPTYKTVNGIEFVEIPTTQGLRSTSSKAIIGSLRSTTPKSTGDILQKALSMKKTLTVFVKESEANTGRKGLSMSLFK